jgi:Sulfotransferase family
MNNTEVTAVERIGPEPEALSGFSIELPAPGTSDKAYNFEFAGWVLGRNSKAVKIELVSNDGPVRCVPIVYPRLDVARAYPGTPETLPVGFRAPISVVGMTPYFEVRARVVLENGVRADIATIKGKHRPVPSHFEPTIQPLLVNSLARMGTTWLMRLLSEHPALVTLKVYPYEVRPARYWMQLVGAMVEPANQAQSSSALGNVSAGWWDEQDPFQRGSLGGSPAVQQWLKSRFVEQVAAMCQSSIEECYREISEAQGQRRGQYFVEKHIPDEVPGIFWELYPKTREVFIVRDFRDMLCSIRAFNAKRGNLGFNRDQVSSEQEYVQRLGREAQQLLSGWRVRKQLACLIRYEDLILKPTTTLQRVLSYVGVESGAAMTEEVLRKALIDTPELQAHRTSDSATASIGRWRRDLDDESKAMCNEVFGVALQEFGYDV